MQLVWVILWNIDLQNMTTEGLGAECSKFVTTLCNKTAAGSTGKYWFIYNDFTSKLLFISS